MTYQPDDSAPIRPKFWAHLPLNTNPASYPTAPRSASTPARGVARRTGWHSPRLLAVCDPSYVNSLPAFGFSRFPGTSATNFNRQAQNTIESTHWIRRHKHYIG